MSLALVYALASAVSWGAGDFVSGVKARTVGVLGVLVPAQVVGLAVAAALVAGHRSAWPGPTILFALPAALAAGIGLVALFRGMAIGAISVVAPIAGLCAVVPVIFGVAAGDNIGGVRAAGFAAALGGVVLASRERGAAGSSIAAGTGLGLVAATCFGLYYPALHAAALVDPWWSVLLYRITLTALVTTALLVARAPFPARVHLPVIALAGLLDVGGNLLYALASSEQGLVSVISVLAALYPVVTVALATALLRERPSRWQWVGVAFTFAGIALISAA